MYAAESCFWLQLRYEARKPQRDRDLKSDVNESKARRFIAAAAVCGVDVVAA